MFFLFLFDFVILGFFVCRFYTIGAHNAENTSECIRLKSKTDSLRYTQTECLLRYGCVVYNRRCRRRRRFSLSLCVLCRYVYSIHIAPAVARLFLYWIYVHIAYAMHIGN